MNILIKSLKNYGFQYTFIKIINVFFNKFLTNLSNRKTKNINLDKSNMIQQSSNDTVYNEYLLEQIDRSFSRSSYRHFFLKFFGSRDKLIKKTREKINFLNLKKEKVLSIGCRDTRELKNIELILKAKNTIGVDLFSLNEAIKIADMHNLPFPNNSFDVIFSIHSMEHSYNPQKALSEIYRTIKNHGIFSVEVPINFEVTTHDRKDFKSIDHLYSFFDPSKVKLIWHEIEDRSKISKPSTLRAIFQKIS